MYGAGVYLERTFSDLNRNDVRDVLGYWMESFSERLEAGEVGA